jgi:hypothetical protein
MPAGDLQYRFRIRTATDEADLFSVTTVRDGLNPFIAEPPDGDGSTLDPLTGKVSVGAYTVRVIDAPGFVYSPGREPRSRRAGSTPTRPPPRRGLGLHHTMPAGTITVGATDQVHGGTKSLKMTTTATGGGVSPSGRYLRAVKVYDSGDGITAEHAVHRLGVRAAWTPGPGSTPSPALIVNGVEAGSHGRQPGRSCRCRCARVRRPSWR